MLCNTQEVYPALWTAYDNVTDGGGGSDADEDVSADESMDDFAGDHGTADRSQNVGSWAPATCIMVATTPLYPLLIFPEPWSLQLRRLWMR